MWIDIVRRIKRSLLLLVGILAVVNLLAGFLFYQTRPVYPVTIGVPGDSWYIDNFYAIEKNERGSYRWTRDGATVTLPSVGSPFEVKVRGTAYRPPGQPQPDIKLTWNNPPLTTTLPGSASLAQYTLQSGSRPVFNLGNGTLTINSSTFQPSRTDDRQLGIVVEEVAVQARPNALGFVLPPVLPWIGLALGLLAIQGWLLAFANSIFAHNKKLLSWRKGLWPGLAALPVVLLLVGLLAPRQALDHALALGVGLAALGGSGLGLLRFREKALPWIGLGLVGLVLGVLYNLFNYTAPLTLACGLVVLCLAHNSRFSRHGFNLLLISSVAVFASWGLLQGRYFRTIDAEPYHFYWINQLDLLVREGDFYPRWAPLFSYEHGSTIFNFYPPLSRYLAEGFILLGLPPAFAFMAMLCGVAGASGLACYGLAREFVGGLGAVVAAIAYIYHPYRLAEFYQRGDMAEIINFVFFPLVLLVVVRLMRLPATGKLRLVALGGGALALALLSHQLSTFYFGVFLLVPFILLNAGWHLWQEGRNKAAVVKLVLRLVWLAPLPLLAVGLSAFYVLPVALESQNVRVSNKVDIHVNLGFLDTTIDNWKDLISAVRPQEYNDRSMTNLAWIGTLQLVLAGLSLLLVWLPISSFTKTQRWLALLFGLLIGLLLFVQTPLTIGFWRTAPAMIFIQFPWRLMMCVALLAALLIGYLAENITNLLTLLLNRLRRFAQSSARPLWVGIAVAFGLALAVGYGGAGRVDLIYYPPSFTAKYKLSTLINQIENGDIFYVPKIARALDKIDSEPNKYNEAFIERNGQRQPDQITFERVRGSQYRLTADLKEPGLLVIPVFYFEGWTLTSSSSAAGGNINSQKLPVSYNQPFGFVTAPVGSGEQTFDLRFEDTPLRTGAVGLTFISILVLLGLLFGKRLNAFRSNRGIIESEEETAPATLPAIKPPNKEIVRKSLS